MPVPISGDCLPTFGITLRHEQMDNGELRFRLTGADQSSYIRCENPGPPVWENAHAHSRLRELVLVQRGRVVFVESAKDAPRFLLLEAGDFALTTPGIPHTQWLDRDTVVHTVKFGDCTDPDWIPAPHLDAVTHPLDPSETLSRVRQYPSGGK
ncbi:MAG: hypothetical protein DBX44_05425 [Oscillospiraceae bacterium]|nr:MAG: hypothetical protein DBX44_05425 [Oscillospiraceae bacterium]